MFLYVYRYIDEEFGGNVSVDPQVQDLTNRVVLENLHTRVV